MKKRNPLAVIFLSIITFGIYDIYWLYKTKEVLNKETRYHVPTLWLLVLPFVILIIGYCLLVYSDLTNSTNITGSYQSSSTLTKTYYPPTGNCTNGLCQSNNITQSDNLKHPGVFIASMITIFVGFISVFITSMIWFFKFSKAINEYTKGKMSTAVTFLILWFIHLIGVALIQDTFNDMQEDGFNQPLPQNPIQSNNGNQYQSLPNQTMPNQQYIPPQQNPNSSVNQPPPLNQNESNK